MEGLFTCAACSVESEVAVLHCEGGVGNVDASPSGCGIALKGAVTQDRGAVARHHQPTSLTVGSTVPSKVAALQYMFLRLKTHG